MKKDKINYIEEFRKLFSAEYIIIKTKSGTDKLENVSVYWDPEKIYILDKEGFMTFINIESFLEIKYTKNTSENLCSMIVVMTVSKYSELFSKREYSNSEVG